MKMGDQFITTSNPMNQSLSPFLANLIASYIKPLQCLWQFQSLIDHLLSITLASLFVLQPVLY